MKKKYADMDPLEEIRTIREEISREFKTVLDLGEYLRNKPPADSPTEPKHRGRRSSGKAGERSAPPRRKQTVKA